MTSKRHRRHPAKLIAAGRSFSLRQATRTSLGAAVRPAAAPGRVRGPVALAAAVLGPFESPADAALRVPDALEAGFELPGLSSALDQEPAALVLAVPAALEAEL